MRRWLLALLLLLPFPAAAQYQVIASCGTPPATLVAGQQVPGYVDLTGVVCTAGSGGGTTTNVVTNSSTSSVTTNFSTINNVAMDVGGGTKGNGTLRVTLATDQAQLTNPLLTTPTSTQACAGSNTFVNGTTAAITDTTSTQILASAGASTRNCVTSVIVTNSHATVGTFVKILDGSTIIWEGYAAAAGGGFTSSFPVPLRGTAATAVNCQPVTTGANVICSAAGYTGT